MPRGPIRDLAELVIQTLGSKSRIEFVDYREAYPAGFEDMLRRRPRVEKLAASIGFRPATSLRAIIELTAREIPGSKDGEKTSRLGGSGIRGG